MYALYTLTIFVICIPMVPRTVPIGPFKSYPNEIYQLKQDVVDHQVYKRGGTGQQCYREFVSLTSEPLPTVVKKKKK